MKRRIDRGSVRLPPRAWRPRRATTAAARAAARAKPRRGKERERERERRDKEGGKKVMEKLHLWSCVRIGERTGQKTKVSDLNWQTPEPGWNNVSASTGAVQRPLAPTQLWATVDFYRCFFFFFFTPFFFILFFAQRSEIIWMRSRDWSAPTGEAEWFNERTRRYFFPLSLLLLMFLQPQWATERAWVRNLCAFQTFSGILF